MKNIILLLALFAFACSEDQDPTPTAARVAEEQEAATGCQAITELNNHTNGQKIKFTAILSGCRENVVFEVRNDASNFRKPSACDKTEQAVSFASTGTVLKVGLYVCGGQTLNSGVPYTLQIENSGVVTEIKTQVGNVNLYNVK